MARQCEYIFGSGSQCPAKARYQITYKNGSKKLFCGRHGFDINDGRTKIRILR